MKQEILQSTAKDKSRINGFSVVEVVLAAGLFGLIITALTSILIYGEESSALAGQRARATFLAEEGLEAVRNIRDENFTNLTDGNYGLQVLSNQWGFSGTSDTTDVFTRQINISTIDSNRKSITSTITWQQNPQRIGSVVLTTRLTYWQKPATITCASYCISLVGHFYIDGTCRRNNSDCNFHWERRETGGNIYCTVNPNRTCCCH